MRLRRAGVLTVRQTHWEAHETVTIKGFSTPEQAYINDQAGVIDPASGKMAMQMGQAQLYTLIFGILSWTLTDEYGKGLPWPDLYKAGSALPEQEAIQGRMASLAQLAPEDSNFLAGEIGKLNAPKTKEDLEAFLASAAPGSAAKPDAPLALPLSAT